jgi:hypothetical protein
MTGGFGRFLRHNTIALIALFFALAGTTFAASTALPRNSVGTKQIKKNAVTSVKIKNNQVTGADVKESSLAKVPKAANADHATSADSATNATNAAALGGNPPSAFAPVAQEATHIVGGSGEPAFQNGWVNFGSGWSFAGFFKDSFGVVHLQGTIKSGTAGSAAFTLPAGYRPAQNLFMPVGNNPYMYILATGEVQPQNTTDIGFDGLSFRAASSTARAQRPSKFPGH